MWSSLFLHIIISVFIVMILHYLWEYLKNTYFKKYSKTKDLVNTQLQKYKNIIEELQEKDKKDKKDKIEEKEGKEIDMEKDLEKFMEEMVL